MTYRAAEWVVYRLLMRPRAGVAKLGDSVNSALYWDGGHAVNFDSPDLIGWIGKLTGYSV